MTQSGAFRAEVDILATAANNHLPRLARHLSDTTRLFQEEPAHEGVSADLAEMQALRSALTDLNDTLTAELVKAVTAVAATAETLAEIVELYRRADGSA